MSRPPRSLRLRLLAGAAMWIAGALLIAGLVLAGLFARHVDERFAAELGHHLDQLAAAVQIDGAGEPTLVRPLSDPRFGQPLSGLYWQVAADDGTILRSRSLWDQTLALPPAADDDGRVHERRIEGPERRPLLALERSLLLPDVAVALRIAVAEDLGALEQARRSFNRTLALSLVALAAALILAAVAQVALGLAPLHALRVELAEIRAGGRRRLARPMPSEVQPLVDDLNSLLDHADAVVERARLQAGNLAHGLKTNLAVLGNEADRFSGTHQPQEAATFAGLVAAQVASMRRHLDHHMARARAAATRGVPGQVADVAGCAQALTRVMEKLHAGRDLRIESEVEAGLGFAGDRQDLEEMLGNLLDNACKWANGRVLVSAARDGPLLVIGIDDDGCGLSPEQMRAVVAPGVRLDESIPGTGLGLGVVVDLARSYGGSLSLLRSPRLGGLRAALHLPAVSPPRR